MHHRKLHIIVASHHLDQLLLLVLHQGRYTRIPLLNTFLQVLNDRQCDYKTGVNTLLWAHWDCSAQLERQIARDVQTETYTFLVDALVLLHDLTEDLEQVLLIVFTDAYTSVINLKFNGIFHSQKFAVLFKA